MEQRISLVTLGVVDLGRARTFYEPLGWHGREVEETVFFQAGGIALVLRGRDKLANDAGIEDSTTDGFGGIALAHNVRSRAEVDQVLHQATTAGAAITQTARETFYGGHAGSSPIRTATSGRSPTTPASHSTGMVRSPLLTTCHRPQPGDRVAWFVELGSTR